MQDKYRALIGILLIPIAYISCLFAVNIYNILYWSEMVIPESCFTTPNSCIIDDFRTIEGFWIGGVLLVIFIVLAIYYPIISNCLKEREVNESKI